MSSEAPKKAGKEGRRTPRRVYQRPIGVLCRGQYQVLQALQLSEGGLLFQTEKKFATKDQTVLSLVMPGGGVIVARGELIYERAVPGSTAP